MVHETDVTIDRAYDKITKLIDDGIPFLCIESSGVKRLIKINMIEEITEVKAERTPTTNINVTFSKSGELSVEELADKISKVLDQELIKGSY